MDRIPSIREAVINDIEDIVILHRKNLSDARTDEVWRWEYFNRERESAFLFVISDDSELIGTQGILPYLLNIRGQTILSGKSESTLIDKKKNGHNFFINLFNKTIAEANSKQIEIIWGITSLPKIFKLLFGFETSSCISSLVLSYRFKSVEKTLVPHLASNSKAYQSIIRFTLRIYCRLISHWIDLLLKLIESVEIRISETCSDAEMNTFFGKIRINYPSLVHIEHNNKFIDWRIKANPKIKGYTFFAFSDIQLSGIMYLTLKNNNIYIDEFLFIEKRAAHSLMNKLLSLCKTQNIGLVIYIGNKFNKLNQFVFNYLKLYGFLKSPFENSDFIVKNLSYYDDSYINDINNWYITHLYAEGI